MVNCMSAAALIIPLSMKEEAVQAPWPVCTFPARNQTPDHSTHKLVTVSTELSQLQNFKISFFKEFCNFKMKL
jgi:hypothetical protein